MCVIEPAHQVNYIPDDEPENDDDLMMNSFSCELEPLPLDAPETSTLELASLGAFMLEYTNTTSEMDHNNSSSNVSSRRRRVCFADEPTEIKVPSFACLAEDQRQKLWYRHKEIDYFRTTARHACRKLRINPFAFPKDITRGLEFRTSLDRQLRKHLALTCILKAQTRYPPNQSDDSSGYLAEVARQSSEMPRREAEKQGALDYCAVYHPDICDWTSPSFAGLQVTTKRRQQQCGDDSMIRLSKRHRSSIGMDAFSSPAVVAVDQTI